MFRLIRQLPHTNRTLIALGVVVGALWLLVAAMLFSTLSAYRLKTAYDKARRHYRQGRVTAAVNALNETLRIDPGFPHAYTLAGKIHYDAKDYEKAAEYFRNAMKLGGSQAVGQEDLALTIIMRNYLPGAALDRNGKNMLHTAAENSPGNGDILVNLGNVYLYEGNTAQALEQYEKALMTRNISTEGLVNLYIGKGVALTRKARNASGAGRDKLLAEASEHFRKAELLEPANLVAKANRLQVDLAMVIDHSTRDYARRRVIREAERFFERNRRHLPQSFTYAVMHNTAARLYEEGKYAESVEAFRKAAELNPLAGVDTFNEVIARLALVRKFSQQKNLDDTRRRIKRLAELKLATPAEEFAMLAELAAIEYAEARLDASLEHYEQLEERITDEIPPTLAAIVYRGLAVLYFEKGEVAKSRRMVENAVNADPAMNDFDDFIKRISQPPRLDKPVVVTRPYLPESFCVMKTVAYCRSLPELLNEDDFEVTFGSVPGVVGFTEDSGVVALPLEPLGEGAHTVKVRVTDSLGNTAEASTQWVVDKTPPSATVNPPPDSTLEPGANEFTITLKDSVAGVDYPTVELMLISKPLSASLSTMQIIEDGKFTEAAGLDVAGAPVREEQITVRLKEPLATGTYTFVLKAADRQHNKMPEFKWTYRVRPEGTNP